MSYITRMVKEPEFFTFSDKDIAEYERKCARKKLNGIKEEKIETLMRSVSLLSEEDFKYYKGSVKYEDLIILTETETEEGVIIKLD